MHVTKHRLVHNTHRILVPLVRYSAAQQDKKGCSTSHHVHDRASACCWSSRMVWCAVQAVVKVVTSGSPRLFNPAAAAWYDRYMGAGSVLRLVNNRDVVPSLPFQRTACGPRRAPAPVLTLPYPTLPCKRNVDPSLPHSSAPRAPLLSNRACSKQRQPTPHAPVMLQGKRRWRRPCVSCLPAAEHGHARKARLPALHACARPGVQTQLTASVNRPCPAAASVWLSLWRTSGVSS